MTSPAAGPPPHNPESSDGKDDSEADLPILQNLKEQDQKRHLQVAGVIGAVVALLVTQLAPGSGWLFLILGIPFAVGAAVGRYVLRGRAGIRSLASWTGLVAWLLPILGMLVAGAVFTGQDPTRPIVRERILAGVAFLLSVGNTVVGVMLKRS